MNRQAQALLAKINAKVEEVKKLAESHDLAAVKAAKHELDDMQEMFNCIKDLDDAAAGNAAATAAAGSAQVVDGAPTAKQKIEEDYRRRLRQTINRELDMVGISHRAVGRDYLCDAIEMICHKRQTYICAEVAKKYKKSDPSVERAMQNAINSAWRKTDIETLEKCYTAPISSEKGVPTLMEFIFYYADKVKSAV